MQSSPSPTLSTPVLTLARALRCRVDGVWPALIRNGMEFFAARQQFTVIDLGCPHHGASFDLALANLSESALALGYAEVVNRFAVAA